MGICDKQHGTLDALNDLPESQAGKHRHKCAACAYEAGRKSGWVAALDYCTKIHGEAMDRLLEATASVADCDELDAWTQAQYAVAARRDREAGRGE